MTRKLAFFILVFLTASVGVALARVDGPDPRCSGGTKHETWYRATVCVAETAIELGRYELALSLVQELERSPRHEAYSLEPALLYGRAYCASAERPTGRTWLKEYVLALDIEGGEVQCSGLHDQADKWLFVRCVVSFLSILIHPNQQIRQK